MKIGDSIELSKQITEDEKADSVIATIRRSNLTCSRNKKVIGCPKNSNVSFGSDKDLRSILSIPFILWGNFISNFGIKFGIPFISDDLRSIAL